MWDHVSNFLLLLIEFSKNDLIFLDNYTYVGVHFRNNELLNNENRHKEMASLARSRYEKRYTHTAFISAMKNAFESVTNEPKVQTDA